MFYLGESVYWSHIDIPPNPTEILNTVPLQKVRGYFTNLGNAVAATSYALMLHLEKNDWDGATAIMKWLQTQRNAMLRWSGTQVSVDSQLNLNVLRRLCSDYSPEVKYLVCLKSTLRRNDSYLFSDAVTYVFHFCC